MATRGRGRSLGLVFGGARGGRSSTEELLLTYLRLYPQFIITAFSLALAGRYLERVWGQLEFLKFVAVVTVASNVIAVIVNVLESYVLGDKALFMWAACYQAARCLRAGMG